MRAPSSGPLLAAPAPAGEADEANGPTPEGETDPLVSNGLGSPLCRPGLASGGLSAAELRHCETSGFVAAAAPTGNYGIDVHIDIGLLGISSGGFLSAVQNLFVTPLWLALVWAVHAVVVMLEWCFTVDLVGTAASQGIGRGLRQMEKALTMPWLAVALAIAAVQALYGGLIRRRVSEAVGRSLVMTAMMAGGLWVIADPAGTVGALGQWANGASLGTLAVAARGSPAGAGAALANSMDSVFAAAIEAPWCYLEFGDVAWCRDPQRLDPGLRTAGLKIAAQELRAVGCKQNDGRLLHCVHAGGVQARALEHSAQLLREAHSNGALFLALPANGSARNSINEPGSLLRTLCRSSEATHCSGPNAAHAEFRTNGGTWSRVGGLLLIAVGVLGMLLLLGFFALRLLAAALFSLLYLLLAPGMVLTPALGDGGRALFRKWATQLLGAVVSKLLFSFLLGVVLAVVAILSDLQALGWWTQWLLMSAFWWGAFARRRQALGVAERSVGREQGASNRPVAGSVKEALETPRRAVGQARATFRRLGRVSNLDRARTARAPRRESSHARTVDPPARVLEERGRASRALEEQALRTLEFERREARERLAAAPATERSLAAGRSRLQRVRKERATALARGDTRRAAELLHRGTRIEGQIERDRRALDAARRLAAGDDRASPAGGTPRLRDRLRARQEFLDRQAELAGSIASGRSAAVGPAERRDYLALAGLAGHARREYEGLAPGSRRAARLRIDRELALRRELNASAGGHAPAAHASAPRRVSNGSDRLDAPPQRRGRDGVRGRHGSGEPEIGRRSRVAESSVMRDAREVAARRKRQLGHNRP